MAFWYERVQSHANIADGPSRGDFSICVDSERVHPDLPAIMSALQDS